MEALESNGSPSSISLLHYTRGLLGHGKWNNPTLWGPLRNCQKEKIWKDNYVDIFNFLLERLKSRIKTKMRMMTD